MWLLISAPWCAPLVTCFLKGSIMCGIWKKKTSNLCTRMYLVECHISVVSQHSCHVHDNTTLCDAHFRLHVSRRVLKHVLHTIHTLSGKSLDTPNIVKSSKTYESVMKVWELCTKQKCLNQNDLIFKPHFVFWSFSFCRVNAS